MPKKKQRSKQNGREFDSINWNVELDESHPALPRRSTLQTSNYYKLVLNKRRTYLINNLDLESHVILLDHLVENDVITKDQYDHIKDKKGRERVAKLLDALSMKDTQAFFAFLNLLRETGDDFIADELIGLCQQNNLSIPVEMKPSHIQNHQESMHTSTSRSTEFSSSYFVSSQESGGPIHETVRQRHPKAVMQNPSTRAVWPSSHVHMPEQFSSPSGYHKPPDVVEDLVTCLHGRAFATCYYCHSVSAQSFQTRGLTMINDAHHDKSCGEFKVIVLGKSNAGKSSLLHGFLFSSFTLLPATVGLDEQARTFEYKGKRYTFVFYDTAGQESFDALTENYIRDAHGVLLVYDVSENENMVRASLQKCSFWKEKLDLDQTVFLLVGNKADIATKDGQDIAIRTIKEFPGLTDIRTNFTSAFTGLHVADVFYNIALDVIRNFEKDPESRTSSSVKLRNTGRRRARHQKGCC